MSQLPALQRRVICVLGFGLLALVVPSLFAAVRAEAPAQSLVPISPTGERELAQRFAFLNSRLLTFAPGWLASPDQLDQAFGRPAPAWLTSELGEQSRFVIRQVAGGPETRYLIVTRRDTSATTTTKAATAEISPKVVPLSNEPFREWLWPASELPPTDIVYDVTDELLHGKAKPILCDLIRAPVRVLALLPTQVERLSLQATQTVTAGESLRAEAACGDASDRVVKAKLPLLVTLVRPDGGVEREERLATNRNGQLQLAWQLIPTALPGDWKLMIHCQLNGLEAELPIRVTKPTAASERDASKSRIVELTSRELRRDWRPKPLAWRDK